jgi:hypothetical protein
MTRYPQPIDKSVNNSPCEYPQTYSHPVNNPVENIYGKPVDNLWKTQAGPVGLSGGLIHSQPRITSKISIISNPCCGDGVCCHCITEAMP